MKIRLSIAAGSGVRTTFEHTGPVIRIGREPDCELALQGEAADMVSRQHAQIELSADGASLSDAGSSNGTLLNDVPLNGPAELHVGDRIRMGYTGATLTILELDLAPAAPKSAARVWVPVVGGTAAALAVIAVLVVVFWPKPKTGAEEQARGPANEATSPTPTDTTKTPPSPAEENEALARGPVHEAYAQPIDYQPKPGPVVAKKPPEPLDELPPSQKPDGDDVQWLPGYWDSDEEGKDYLWVSGLWRETPPEHHWVPGAWQEVEDGWQWSPGFWASDKSQKIEYVPYPPPPPTEADADAAAPLPQPADEGWTDTPRSMLAFAVDDKPAAKRTDIRVPGSWLWRDERWVWRPPFGLTPRPGWVWNPAHYIWTPGGAIFNDGYWDYPLERRGLLLAPMRMRRPLGEGFAFVPQFVVRPDFLLGSLFVGPRRRRYHFGDHFAAADVKRGFTPWFDYHPTRHGFDPLYDYYRLAFLDEPMWDRNLRELYRARLAGEVLLPPHNWGQQQKLTADLARDKKDVAKLIKDINITRADSIKALSPLAKEKLHEERMMLFAALAPRAKFEPHVVKTHQLKPQDRVGEREQIQHALEVARARREYEAKLLAAGTVHAKPMGEKKFAPFEVAKGPRGTAHLAKSPPLPAFPKWQVRVIPVFRPPFLPRPPNRLRR